jgi:hypothetical protein
MKTEKTLTTDSQPVTWGNRVATILMIGVFWFFPFMLTWLANQWTISLLWKMAAMFGTYAATVSFVISMFVKSKSDQSYFRGCAWIVVPVSLVILMLVHGGHGEDLADIYGVTIQFAVLGTLSAIYYFSISKDA